jgi:phage terminase small subunit
MALTQKQENFCLSYVEQGNASEAYRRSFNAVNMKPDSINNKAYELLKRVDITARVDEIRAAAAKRNAITVDDLIAELEEARQAALTAETVQASAATGATMGKAKLLGMDKQVLEHTGNVTILNLLPTDAQL